MGQVVSDKMDKTVVVAVRWQQRHRLYRKSLRRITKFYAHDEGNSCRLGDSVRIQETRALSRLKRWRVLEIVGRRDVPEVRPIELDEGILSEEAAAQVLEDGQEEEISKPGDEEIIAEEEDVEGEEIK